MSLRPRSAAPLAVVLALLWSRLWWHQRQVWESDPELMFGWAVPVLMLFLGFERWLDRPPPSPTSAPWCRGCLVAGAVAWAGSVLVLTAFPFWTVFLWLQNAAAVSLTLGCIGLVGGHSWMGFFAFPLFFSFTALPWPAVLQQQLGQALMGGITRVATVLLNEGGIPAVAVGNVIETSRGWVGVEEACSGLRSLQASLMMALFLGEYHRFRPGRRLALTGLGLIFALTVNLLRTLWLTWQAAHHGSDAVAAWHDPAGYAALVLNAGSLACLSWRWSPASASPPDPARPGPLIPPRWETAHALLFLLPGLLLVTEAAVQSWFSRGTETASPALSSWEIAFPKDASAFQPMEFAPVTRAMLACERLSGATWRTAGGARRAGYVIDWNQNQGGREIARLHNPLVCLPASGARMTSDEGTVSADLNGRNERFRFIRFTDGLDEFVVFFTVLPGGENTPAMGTEPDARASDGGRDWWTLRWAAVRAGRRPDATRLLTLAFWQVPPGTEADMLRTTLRSLVRSGKTPTATP